MFDDDDAPEEATFPLLRLPNNAIKNVINQMTIFQIFGFSLISNRTCQLVSESYRIQKKSRYSKVAIGFSIEIKLNMFTRFTFRPSHREIDQNPSQNIRLTGLVRRNWIGYVNYSKEGFTMEHWIRHIFKVFNFSWGNVHLIWLNDTERYNVASVKRIFPKCDRLTINISNPQLKLVTDTFLPKSIELSGNGPHLAHGFHKILIQNFSRATLKHGASFDTILMTNSKCFNICPDNLTEKEVNRFLKLWIRGALPNLKHFSSALRCEAESSQKTIEAIFKGIKHKLAIEQIQCGECRSVKHGGFVVNRIGGTRAVVSLYAGDSGEYSLFDIFVGN